VEQALAQPKATGVRGIVLSFVNYLDELPLLRDEVMARLARMELREGS
jgi:hypothetical protein